MVGVDSGSLYRQTHILKPCVDLRCPAYPLRRTNAVPTLAYVSIR